ncbi:MAG: hypothetical protein KY475_10375 [Planctomycetes bacterium]|nr:hypothetical protein [Planctomycetota bacterium]
MFQFAMTLIGFGAEEMGLDGMDGGGHHGMGDVTDAGHSGDAGGDHHGMEHDSSNLFKMFTFRSLVAAIAFFGIAGMTASKAELDAFTTLGIALVAGALALYFVGWLFQSMHRLAEDGNVRIEHAVGLPGTVYIPIPERKSGAGKIQLKLQNRIVELRAVTSEAEKLPTGANVVVVEVINANTVEVELAREPAKT